MKWSYYTVRVFVAGESTPDKDALDRLGRLGADGWELVCVSNGWAFLKKPISES